MKIKTAFVVIAGTLLSCAGKKDGAVSVQPATANPMIGTWKLIEGSEIDKGDTVVTDYTKTKSFIKVINDTHFAFLLHDLNKGKDSTAAFVAGGGTYSLHDHSYTENLEYCSNRVAEGNSFTFNVEISNDTLVQSGLEKIESTGASKTIIEKYTRLKK